MPKVLINEGVLVIRDGKRVRPQIGKLFNLSAEEIAQLREIRPTAISQPKDAEEDARSKDDTDDAAKPADANNKQAASGKKAADKAADKGAPAKKTDDSEGL